MHAACGERADVELGGRAWRGAHHKRLLHVRDEGRVPAQWLVELVRVLRATRQEVGRDCAADWGAGRGEKLTSNIQPMLVTLEVSQLRGWLKACACCRGSQSGHTVRCGRRGGSWEAASDARSVAARGRETADLGEGRGEQRT